MRHRYVVLTFSLLLAALVAVPAIGQSTDPTATGAKSAKKVAKQAKKKAKKALSKARQAQSSADAAQASANSAQSSADSAQATANSAQNSANSAQATADNSLQKPVRQVEEISTETSGSAQFRTVTASCPAGERAIAGGGIWTFPNGNNTGFNKMNGTKPVPTGPGTDTITGWQANGTSDSASPRVLRAYAVCVPE